MIHYWSFVLKSYLCNHYMGSQRSMVYFIRVHDDVLNVTYPGIVQRVYRFGGQSLGIQNLFSLGPNFNKKTI